MTARESLRFVYRKSGIPEKLFAVLVAVYLPLRWTAPAGTLRFIVELGVTLAGLLVVARLARWGIRKSVWRLRNRLVVAYLFIAVVPIALMLLLAGIGAYMLTGQIAVYLVTSQLDQRIEGLLAPAHELLATPPAERAARIRDMAQMLLERYPNLELIVRDRSEWRFPEGAPISLPPGRLSAGSGLILKAGQPYMWSHSRVGAAEAFLLVPLTRSLLASLVPELGNVLLAGFPGAHRDTPIAVPVRAGWLDIGVDWGADTRLINWRNPGESRQATIVVTTRPSAVVRALFSQRGDPYQGNLGVFFVTAAVAFLAVELIALMIGVSMTRAITSAVHGLYEGTQRVTRGDFGHRIEVRGDDQLAELSRSFNHMTENIERLLSVEKEKERLQSELEIASEVQSQLYPKSVPVVEGLELLARCSPARTVSGDYYDYLSLTDDRLGLAIGDVAGKGISAALLMATLQSSLRTQVRACIEAAAAGLPTPPGGLSAAHFVSQLNQQLYAFTSAEKFATFYFGIYDSRSGRLSYTNAGHPPPIVVRNGTTIRLETNGIVVGAFPFAEYGESEFELQPGDLFACFTDGLTEPENEYGEMFGEDRLVELLRKNAGCRPAEIIDAVYAAVRQWAVSPEAQDDMTMLVARRL